MKRKVFAIIALMVAGEAVFLLAFVLPRVFRPTFLTVFHLTNFELGTAFSVYGVIAMFSYFLGGPIADRFSAKGLLIISLLLSSLAGLYLYAIPDDEGINLLYGFWGVSTILLFWAAFIKVTRVYGGNTQGLAFGMIDSGRGFFAALLATGSIYVFSTFLPADSSLVTEQDLTIALRAVILIFTGFGCVSAGLIALALQGKEVEGVTQSSISLPNLLAVMKKRSLWYQSLIVLCAYTGYKCTDDFSLYAVDVLGYDDVQAATVGTISFWARGVGAFLAGVLGDRFRMTRVLSICFVIMTVSSLLLSIKGVASIPLIAIINLAVGSTAIYGLRGLYYSIFNISNIPLALTGSAVGLVAVVGYTPEIFMGPLMGVVLDNNPGPAGHYYLFTILALFGIGGITATFLFNREVTNTGN
ncbi:MAG: MFS transporter [Cyclobacteriaceae bacterium]